MATGLFPPPKIAQMNTKSQTSLFLTILICSEEDDLNILCYSKSYIFQSASQKIGLYPVVYIYVRYEKWKL